MTSAERQSRRVGTKRRGGYFFNKQQESKMQVLPKKSEMHAALNRLRMKDGFAAVASLLDRFGVTAGTNDESLCDQIIAACPELRQGEGLMAAKNEKPKAKSPREQIAEMGATFATRNIDDEMATDLRTIIDGAPNLQEGFSRAARMLHARNRTQA